MKDSGSRTPSAQAVHELLRHGSARITTGICAEAMTPAQAQGIVLAMLWHGEEKKEKRRGDENCVSPLCPREKWGFPASLLFCWRPRRDLNPCYRRESTRSGRKLLKLRNTDGYLKRFQ
jgi:hypothetical protein